MVPPVPPAVFGQNPKFNALVKNLTTNKLNADGSTNDIKAEKVQKAFPAEINAAKLQQVRVELLKSGLRNALLQEGDSSPDLPEVVHLVSALLDATDSNTSHELKELLADDLDFFIESLPSISPSLSTYYTTLLTHLSQLLPQPPNSDLPLSTLIQQTKATILHSHHTLEETRISIANLTTEILAQHTTITEQIIRILEQTTHGSIARATKAQTEHLSAVAEGLEKRIRLAALGQQPTEAMQEALGGYGAYLKEEKGRVERRGRALEGELRRYEDLGGGFGAVVERMVEVKGEIERVRGDIERLMKEG